MCFPVKVRLSEDKVETIQSIDKLDELILDLYHRSSRYVPDAITMEGVDDHIIRLGLAEESFVQISKISRSHPSSITMGNRNRLGFKVFFLHQRYPVKIEIKHLIPFSVARRVIERFVLHCEYSEDVFWEMG